MNILFYLLKVQQTQKVSVGNEASPVLFVLQCLLLPTEWSIEVTVVLTKAGDNEGCATAGPASEPHCVCLRVWGNLSTNTV